MGDGTTSSGKTHWQRFGLFYVCLGVVIIAALALFPSEEKAVSRSVLAVAHPGPGASLVATLKSNKLDGSPDEAISFEATTPLGVRIDNMTVCASSPEFTAEPESGCVSVKVFPKSDVSATRTPAVIHLHPTRSSGSSKVLITASWVRYLPRTQPAGGTKVKSGGPAKTCDDDPASCYPVAEKMAMTVGPVNLGINKLTRFAGRLARFLKDLTLPIILIVLANWLSREATERDRKREASEKLVREEKAEKEKHDEEHRRVAERKQEEQKQIAHILLPKVMRLSGHYYLPIVSNLTWFLRVSATTPQNCGELIFYLLSVFHVARSLKEKEGGVFFKDMAAEQLFSITNNVVRGLLVQACGGEKDYMSILDHLDTWVPTGVRRWPRLAEQPATVPQTWIDLEKWIADLDPKQLEGIRYVFNVLAATMRYESNEPYAHWYLNSRRDNLFKLREVIAAPDPGVFGDEYAEDMKEFFALLGEYRKGKEK